MDIEGMHKIQKEIDHFFEDRKFAKKRYYCRRVSKLDRFSPYIVEMLKQGHSLYAVHQFLKIKKHVDVHYSTVLRFSKSLGV